MKRVPWEPVLALAAGLALGLLYAWIISPVRYVDTTPDTLRADFKDAYRASVAAAYAATGDLDRARARLTLLRDPDPVGAITAQAQRMLAEGEPFDVVQQVARLAADLRAGAPISPSFTPAVLAETGTATPAAPVSITPTPATPQLPSLEPTEIPLNLDTPTPRPTRTPTPTPGAPFALIGQESVCNPSLTEGLLQVSVMDARRRQMPGVELIVNWDGGEEHFFTGFKPEIGNGYADFLMHTGLVYTLRVASGGTPAANLSAPTCTDSNGTSYTGGLHITFQEP